MLHFLPVKPTHFKELILFLVQQHCDGHHISSSMNVRKSTLPKIVSRKTRFPFFRWMLRHTEAARLVDRAKSMKGTGNKHRSFKTQTNTLAITMILKATQVGFKLNWHNYSCIPVFRLTLEGLCILDIKEHKRCRPFLLENYKSQDTAFEKKYQHILTLILIAVTTSQILSIKP